MDRDTVVVGAIAVAGIAVAAVGGIVIGKKGKNKEIELHRNKFNSIIAAMEQKHGAEIERIKRVCYQEILEEELKKI